MVDHRAEQILDAVTALVTGLTTTGANVERGRVYPVDTLPALSVYSGENTPVEEPNMAYQDSEQVVRIQAHIKGTSATLEQTANAIRKEVYVAMLANRTLGLGFVIDTRWQGDGEPELDDGAEKPVARMAMNFAVKYRHSYNDPSQ